MSEASAAGSSTRVRAARFGTAAVLALAFLHNAWLIWERCGDPLVDTGQAFEIPRRLAQGERLYADLRYYYGPLAPYVNALAFKFLGAHLNVLAALGLGATALSAWVLYRLTRLFTGRLGAACAVLGFLYLCAFGSYVTTGNHNFVMPYTYSASYGFLAALSSVYFLARHACKGKALDFALALVALSLALLTKLEIAFALLLAHGVAAVGWGMGGRLRRMHAAGYAAALAAAALAYGLLAWQSGGGLLADNLFALLSGGSMAAFSRQHMGLDDPGASFKAAGLSAALLFAVALGVYGLGCLGARDEIRAGLRRGLAIPVASLGLIGYIGLSWTWTGLDAWAPRAELSLPFRCFPFLALGVWAVLAWRFVKRREAELNTLPVLILWTFAGAMLARLGLNAHAYHFGFYMLPAALATFAVLWFKHLPEWFPRIEARWWHWGGAGIFAGLLVTHGTASWQVLAERRVALEGPRGRMYVLERIQGAPTGSYYRAAVELLKALPPGTRVLIVPEGAALAVLAGVELPYGLYHFLPTDLSGDYAEPRLLERLEREPPDVIVRVAYDLSQFGARGFGVDYAPSCGAWIRSHYVPWQAIGPPEQAYLLFLKRRGAPDPVPEDGLPGRQP
ncbi:MAG: hypothetical protein HS116_19460 [Planctomycetes bacterium]|nr:hypothetical protein [Planctomycetota bacterium]